ncbi:hypothetical protein ABZY58_11765 [Micromonospora tulbaghiae]|uniref:hypothetical protein n=1 Tax=Micromonospora tulbaghiae TaxID=479978 RepID=UPI0033BA58BC
MSDRVQDTCVHLAEHKAKPYAVSIAPRATGTYAGAFVVQRITVHGIPAEWPMTRRGAQLTNTDKAAKFIEIGGAVTTAAGTQPTPAHHTLRRTLEYLDATSVFKRPRRSR